VFEEGDVDILGFTDGLTMTAKTSLTLKTSNSDLIPVGALSLTAGTGIYVRDSLTSSAGSGKPLVFNSDNDSTGSNGTLTLSSAQTITSTNNFVTVTAWDVDLQGAIKAGTSYITLHGSENDQTFGLGAASIAGNLHVDTSEMQRISAFGLSLGSSTTNTLTVLDITKVKPKAEMRCISDVSTCKLPAILAAPSPKVWSFSDPCKVMYDVPALIAP
jgi:hypothetical protein